MKATKIAVIILLALGVGCFVGYYVGQRVDARNHLALSLDMDVNLYQKAESGDLAGLKSQLGFFIFGQFNTYTQHFGNDQFLHFDDARRIARFAATNGDVVGFRK